MRRRLVPLAVLMSSVAFTGVGWTQQVIYRSTPHVLQNGVDEAPPVELGAELAAQDLSLQLRSGASAMGRVAVSGGVAPYTFALGADAPEWLSIGSASGTLTGTTSTGSWEVSIRVTDSEGSEVLADLDLKVVGPLTASLDAIMATPGDAISATPMVIGGFEPYAFSWDTTSGPRPAWLTLDPATGALSGPAEAGSWKDLLLSVSDRDQGERFSLPVVVEVEAQTNFQMQRLGGSHADVALAITALSGMEVAITGYTDSPGGAGSHDAFTAVYEASGAIRWRRFLGGSNSDIARGIAAISGGGVAITGNTASPGGAGGNDAFVAAYDRNGTLLWRNALGGTGTDYGQGIAALSGGGVAITGYTASPGGAGGNDAFVAAYDSGGTLLWRSALGGSRADVALGIVSLSDGGVAITGNTGSPGGAGNDDAFVAVYDSSGALLWRKSLGGTGADAVHGITALSGGGVAITGYTASPGGAGGNDAFVAAYDSGGTLLWRSALGGSGTDVANGIAVLPSGGVAIAGSTDSPGGAGGSDAFVAVYDSSGALLWKKVIGGTGADAARGIVTLPSGGMAITGNTDSAGGAGGNDAFVARFPTSGPKNGTYGSFTVQDMPSLVQTNVTMQTDLTVTMETNRTIAMDSHRTVTMSEPTIPMVETKDIGF